MINDKERLKACTYVQHPAGKVFFVFCVVLPFLFPILAFLPLPARLRY